MTKPEITGKRDLTFSRWIRNNLPDSQDGFLVTDLDFLLCNYKTKKIMLLELTQRNTDIPEWQRKIFSNIDRWIKKSIDDNWKYLGLHFIKFENIDFTDGKCYFDNKEITEKKLIEFLSF